MNYQLFCLNDGSCSSSTQCGTESPVSLATTHEIVHEYIANVSLGLNILTFDKDQMAELPDVGPGYSIAFHKPQGIGAELASVVETNAKMYRFAEAPVALGTMLDTSNVTQIINRKVHMKVYYSLSNTLMIKRTYSNVGIYYPRARFSVGGSEVDFFSKIVVSESIEGGNWTVTPSPYIATNDTFSVLVHPLTKGYNVTVTVLYELDHNDTYFVDFVNAKATFEFSYNKRGLKPLSLTYSNALSSAEFSCQVVVQDKVDYLFVKPVLSVPTGNESKIVWYCEQGSYLSYEVDLGDGTIYSNGTFDIDTVLIVHANHVYYAPGEYNVNITVYNDVSNLTITTIASVEDPIVNMTAEVVHAARDIEVNETIQFNVSMINGTSPYYDLDFGDGSSDFGLSSLISHSYTWWQVFQANVTAWNNVSQATYLFNVTVHKPVSPLINFTVTSEPTNLTDPVAFMLNISDGTDYNCTWDFGDGSKGENDYDDLGTYLYHTYNDVGVYVVFVNCSNRLYTTNYTALATVQRPILDFQFPGPGPFKHVENIFFEWSCASGTNATYNFTSNNMYLDNMLIVAKTEDLVLSEDRLTGSLIVPGSVENPLRYGVYAVEITVWNLVTPPQTIRRELVIDKPIENSHLSSLKTHWEVGKVATVTIKMSLGTNVTLVFDFGDGSTYQEFLMGGFPADGVDTSHTYLIDGAFKITLLVKNSVSNVSLEVLLHLEHALDLLLESNSPQIHPIPAIVNFTLVVKPGKQPPTNAIAIWNFGDGTPLITKPFNYHDSHSYQQPGWYIVVVNVYNNVSSMNVTGMCFCLILPYAD